MKKLYLQPETEVLNVNVVEMLAGSITGVGGDSGLTPANPGEEPPTDADVKSSIFEEDFWQ
ncbi:MAG: hypothetical protein J6Y04_10015 [Bacteroidaceae bacterium]|nr:hypothetical protein [Bacteroidaceae bacterium]